MFRSGKRGKADRRYPLAVLARESRYTSSMKELYAEIDDHLKEYESGTITSLETFPFQ
jgi:hypothetical protein